MTLPRKDRKCRTCPARLPRGASCEACKAETRRLRDLHRGRTAEGKEWVRCLGPREPEHTFPSPDRTRVRVCQKCRDFLRMACLSPRAEKTVFDITRGTA